MLLESGDLIPVLPDAVDIPWTRRKSQIMNFLHRGNVNFQTYVYDTNVGDIAPLSTYFNPNNWTVFDLNHKFGVSADSSDHRFGKNEASIVGNDLKSASLQPRLILYPELIRPMFGNAILRQRHIFGNDEEKMSAWSPNFVYMPSSLPSPPKKSPPGRITGEFDGYGTVTPQIRFSFGDKPAPIGPPKKRKLSVDVEDVGRFGHNSGLVQRSKSTSSTWKPANADPCSAIRSPIMGQDQIWMSLNDTGAVFDSPDDQVDWPVLPILPDIISPDENSDEEMIGETDGLVRSLRKIAKAYATVTTW